MRRERAMAYSFTHQVFYFSLEVAFFLDDGN
jgi:hypothetical protein